MTRVVFFMAMLAVLLYVTQAVPLTAEDFEDNDFTKYEGGIENKDDEKSEAENNNKKGVTEKLHEIEDTMKNFIILKKELRNDWWEKCKNLVEKMREGKNAMEKSWQEWKEIGNQITEKLFKSKVYNIPENLQDAFNKNMENFHENIGEKSGIVKGFLDKTLKNFEEKLNEIMEKVKDKLK